MPVSDDAYAIWRQYTGRSVPTFGAPLQILPVWGQSLCLGVIGTGPEKNLANQIDRPGVQMLGGLQRGDTNGPVYVNGPMTAGYNTVNSTGMIPANAAGNIATVQYVAAALRARRGAGSPQVLTCCNGIGGQPVAQFTSGQVHDLMVRWLTEINGTVLPGRTVTTPYAIFIQGEADSNAAPGAYRAGVDAMWSDWRADILAVSGGAAVPCATQIGGYCDSATNKTYNVCIEQIEAVEALGGLVLPPIYPILLADATVHPGDPGYRELADLIAYHLAEHEAGRTIPSFKPTASLSGSTLTLSYPLRAGESLTFHDAGKYTPYGGFCPNQGFQVTGTTITSVSIAGSTVVIECAAPPTAWAYAFQFQDVTSGASGGQNYSGHRGLLRKTAPVASVLGQGDMYQWALSWRGTL